MVRLGRRPSGGGRRLGPPSAQGARRVRSRGLSGCFFVRAILTPLSPQQGDRDELVQIHQYGQVNRAASGPLVELKRLAKEITDAVEQEAGFFQQTIDDRLAESWSWRQNVSWSEEARDALRRAGSVPGEDRTVTIEKDPERLSKRGAEQL